MITSVTSHNIYIDKSKSVYNFENTIDIVIPIGPNDVETFTPFLI
jgi:hypothetical protein